MFGFVIRQKFCQNCCSGEFSCLRWVFGILLVCGFALISARSALELLILMFCFVGWWFWIWFVVFRVGASWFFSYFGNLGNWLGWLGFLDLFDFGV